jgi:hypothetical protein
VVIDLISDDFDPRLEINDSEGNALASDDDGGDGLNARLFFTAPASDTYQVSVTSYEGTPDGDFSLTVASGNDSDFGYDTSLELSSSDDKTLSFAGVAGDVINLYAETSTDEDSVLTLYDPSGEQVVTDDDSGIDRNPFIRRFTLPETGQYAVLLTAFGDEGLQDPITITLEQTELMTIPLEGITITLGESQEDEVLVFDAVDDAQYLISVDAEEDLAGSLSIDLLQEDESYATTSFSVSGVSSFAAIFTADETGPVRVEVRYYSFDGDVDITIAVEPLQ